MKRATLLLVLAACASQPTTAPPPQPVALDVPPMPSASALPQLPPPNAEPYVKRDTPASSAEPRTEDVPMITLTPLSSSNPSSTSTAPFDRGQAAMQLGQLGPHVQGCKKPNGPIGAGHVTITFDPSGAVSVVAVDAGPYPGTTVGSCVAALFHRARVAPFGGPPVRVGKSFIIN